MIEVNLGAGKHLQDVIREHPENFTKFLKVILFFRHSLSSQLTFTCQAIYAGEIVYPPIIVCIKCSILALYYRLFGVRRGFARLCYILMGVTVSWGLATLLPAIFQCDPVRKAWDPTNTEGRCIPLKPYLVGTNVPNVLLDFAILVTPLYPIWSLKLPAVKKLWISGIFVLGAWYVILIPLSKVKIVYLPFIVKLPLASSDSWRSPVSMCLTQLGIIFPP